MKDTKLVIGKNDLVTTNPDQEVFWDYNKNDLPPEMVTANSDLLVWWKCPLCGMEWKETVRSRVRYGNCPQCGNSF